MTYKQNHCLRNSTVWWTLRPRTSYRRSCWTFPFKPFIFLCIPCSLYLQKTSSFKPFSETRMSCWCMTKGFVGCDMISKKLTGVQGREIIGFSPLTLCYGKWLIPGRRWQRLQGMRDLTGSDKLTNDGTAMECLLPLLLPLSLKSECRTRCWLHLR